MSAIERNNNQADLDSNILDCHSRAFFLSGIIDKEEPLSENEIIEIIKNCSIHHKPEINSLLFLFNGKINHIAIVTGINPVKVSDQNGENGETRDNMSLTDLLFDFGGLDIPFVYLKPR